MYAQGSAMLIFSVLWIGMFDWISRTLCCLHPSVNCGNVDNGMSIKSN